MKRLRLRQDTLVTRQGVISSCPILAGWASSTRARPTIEAVEEVKRTEAEYLLNSSSLAGINVSTSRLSTSNPALPKAFLIGFSAEGTGKVKISLETTTPPIT